MTQPTNFSFQNMPSDLTAQIASFAESSEVSAFFSADPSHLKRICQIKAEQGIDQLISHLSQEAYAEQKSALEQIKTSLFPKELDSLSIKERFFSLKERVITVLKAIPMEDLCDFLQTDSRITFDSSEQAQQACLEFPNSALFCAMSIHMGLFSFQQTHGSEDRSVAMLSLMGHSDYVHAAEIARQIPEEALRQKILRLILQKAVAAKFFHQAKAIAHLFPEGAEREAALALVPEVQSVEQSASSAASSSSAEDSKPA